MLQIFIGSAAGLLIAVAIGAAFIAVWFTKASDLWSKSEALWEGIFSLVASILIFVVGITMLKMDKAKAKWRVKLKDAFEGKGSCLVPSLVFTLLDMLVWQLWMVVRKPESGRC